MLKHALIRDPGLRDCFEISVGVTEVETEKPPPFENADSLVQLNDRLPEPVAEALSSFFFAES